jgi:hypothetical protein
MHNEYSNGYIGQKIGVSPFISIYKKIVSQSGSIYKPNTKTNDYLSIKRSLEDIRCL